MVHLHFLLIKIFVKALMNHVVGGGGLEWGWGGGGGGLLGRNSCNGLVSPIDMEADSAAVMVVLSW